MSQLEVYTVFALNERRAAINGRRDAYLGGWVNTRVIKVRELPWNPGYKKQSPPWHEYQVTIEVNDRRIPIHPGNNDGYGQLLWSRWDGDARVVLCKGAAVRTLVVGANYSDGQRHEMAAGSTGVIFKRKAPYVWVSFFDLPGRSFMYAHPDVEPLPAGEPA